MELISVSRFAQQHNLSERTVRNWCATGKIDGAVLVGKTWNIPADAPLPRKGKLKESPLLKRLRDEKEGRISGGIYHRTQIDLTYNSNHIEGSRLTHEQTRYIFETNTISITDESVNVDDIVETINHFYYRGLREWGHINGFLRILAFRPKTTIKRYLISSRLNTNQSFPSK